MVVQGQENGELILKTQNLKWFLLACTESQLTGLNFNTDWTGYDGCINWMEDLNSKAQFKITSRE